MLPHRLWTRAVEGLVRDANDPLRPIIVANPPGDRPFRDLIETALAGTWRPEDLEAMLRSRYPNAVVRRRELAGERTDVWYVYRDGHWIRSERDAGTER
jgi:hypothetical protein